MKKITSFIVVLALIVGCSEKNNKEAVQSKKAETPFVWEGANMYFLLTDRFNNGDTLNDINFERTQETGLLRGFEGGDIVGITQKIEAGYFTDLGINAIWFTPIEVANQHFHCYRLKYQVNFQPKYN